MDLRFMFLFWESLLLKSLNSLHENVDAVQSCLVSNDRFPRASHLKYRAPHGADKYKFVKSRFLPGLCHPWDIPGQTRPEDSRALCGIFVFIIEHKFAHKSFLPATLEQSVLRICLGWDVATLPGKSSDFILWPGWQDGAQISSHEASYCVHTLLSL